MTASRRFLPARLGAKIRVCPQDVREPPAAVAQPRAHRGLIRSDYLRDLHDLTPLEIAEYDDGTKFLRKAIERTPHAVHALGAFELVGRVERAIGRVRVRRVETEPSQPAHRPAPMS